MPLVLNKGSQRKASAQLLSLTKKKRPFNAFLKWSIFLELQQPIYYIEPIGFNLKLEIQLFHGFLFSSPFLGLSGFLVESDRHIMRGNYQAIQGKKSEAIILADSSQ